MDALEGLGDDRLHALQHGTLGSPVAAGAGAVFLACQHDRRDAVCLVFHGCIEDGHLLAGGLVLGPVAFLGSHQQILQADVGERAARHHQVIAAPGAVRVEVAHLHAALLQEFSRRAVGGDIAGRGNVVGGDRVRPAGPARVPPGCR